MYRFVLWLVPAVEKFPRRQKFLLGDRLQATAFDVLERLVEATYTRDRRHLAAANLGIEKLRFLCRLAKDLGHLDERRYEHAARSLDETGRLIGGWRKADEAAQGLTACSTRSRRSARCAPRRRGRRWASAGVRGRPRSSRTSRRSSWPSNASCGRGHGGQAATSTSRSRSATPKRRTISAAPFRDRVVQHALHAVIAPLFERGFIDHTYANRTEKGTHRALARYERLRDRYHHVLRGDIYRYFPAIDHEVLKADLHRRIACRRTLTVLDRIVDVSNPQKPVNLYYLGRRSLHAVRASPRVAHRAT